MLKQTFVFILKDEKVGENWRTQHAGYMKFEIWPLCQNYRSVSNSTPNLSKGCLSVCVCVFNMIILKCNKLERWNLLYSS